jgi:2-polyprenyl-6-methoxyphenol hydroxylase-like FAD-dependent oxidoreductase
MPRSEPVLVVGAGIAGLGMAGALGRAGVPCVVSERSDGPPDAGLGLNLPGNAVRMLAELGVADDVMRHGQPIRRREYRNGTGRLLFAVDEAAFWDDVGPSVCIRRGELVRILAESVSAPVRWGQSVDAVEIRDADVEVRLQSGQHETYDFVVGADGVGSTLRTAVSPGVEPHQSRMTMSSWRFVVDNPGVDCWTVWTASRGTCLLIPLRDGMVYGYASSSRGGAPGADQAWLAETFRDFPAPVSTAIERALDGAMVLRHSPVMEVDSPRWTRGRTALVGDAAHAMGPVWAQGAALALEDAIVLAALLAGRDDWSSVGEAFEAVRRPRVDRVRHATDRMSKLAALPGWLRDLTAGRAGPKAYRTTYGPLRTSPLESVGQVGR